MRYELGPLLDPEAYANPVVDETGAPVAEQPTTLTGDADRGIGLDPYADLRPNQTDLAPDFIRQIPNVAVDMDRFRQQADEWAKGARTWVADRWAEAQQNDLLATAQEALGQAGTTLTGALDAARTVTPEQRAEIDATLAASRELTNPGRALGLTQEGIDAARAAIRDFNPFGLTPEEQAQRPELGGPFSLHGELAGGAMGAVLPIGIPGRSSKWAPGMDPVLDAFNRPPDVQQAAGPVQRFLDGAERLISDRYAAINKVGTQTEELMALYGGATEGAFQRAADDLGPVYAQIADNLPVLNKYVGLQTYIENAAAKLNPTRKGVGGIQSVQQAQAELARMEADLGPELMAKIRQADDLRTQVMRGILEEKVDAGLVPRAAADLLNERIPHYNPTVVTRFLEELGMGRGGRTLRQMTSTLKRLTEEGSESDVLPPMQAAIKHVMDSDMAIRRNRLVTSLVDEGGFKAQPAIRLTTGMSTESGQLETIVQRGVSDPRGKALFMKEGQPWVAELPDDIAKTLDRMSTEHLRAADELAIAMNRSLRVGATALNPSFLAANATRDYIASFMREGLLPTEYAAGLAEALARGPLYRQYMRIGGGMGSAGRAAGFYRGPSRAKNLAEVEKEIQSAGGTMLSTPRDLSQLVRAIERHDLPAMAKYFTDLSRVIPITELGEAIEQAPRLGTFGRRLPQTNFLSGKPGTYIGYRGGTPNALGDARSGGTYIAQNKAYAQEFANAAQGGALHEVRVRVDNPFMVAEGRNAERLASAWNRLEGKSAAENAALATYLRESGLSYVEPKVADWLRKQGFDAIISPRDPGVGDYFGPVMIGLDPKKIELAQDVGRLARRSAESAAVGGRRVSVDFNRAGELTRVLNYYAPFLNARIQGSLTTARSLRDNPGSRVRAGLLAGAAAATYFYNRQFGDRFTDVPDYLRENGFGVIMLPWGAEKKTDGPGYEKNPYITLPLGEWGAISTGVEETLRALDGTDRNLMDAIGRVVNAANPLPGGEGLTGTALAVAPVTAPVKALLEQAANYDFFRHRPIESESMQNMLPELRYNPRTPEAAKRIADALADKPFVPEWLKSPVRIEHLVGASTGGAGRLALQGASTLMGQETDRPPVAGGLFSTVYRTYGGAIEQRAYEERDAALRDIQQQYRPMIRAIEENTGSGSVTQVPSEIAGGIPLQPADQLVYQRARLATLQEILVGEPGLDEELAQLTPTERKSVFSSFIKAANQVAAAITAEQIAEDELVRRVEQKQEPNKRRSLPKQEYTPVAGR